MHKISTIDGIYLLSKSKLSFQSNAILILSEDKGSVIDEILDSAVEAVVDSIGKEIGGAVIKKIFGSQNKWEKEVSSQLSIIINKLDEIIQSIEELKQFFRESQLQSIREMLRVVVIGNIQTISDVIDDIRTEKKLTAASKDQLTQATKDLSVCIDGILRYVEENTNKPLGLPLYGAVQAGVIMLDVGFRILNSKLAKSKLERAIVKLEEWHRYLNDISLPMISSAHSETTYLESQQKLATCSLESRSNQYTQGININEYYTILKVRIEGGASKDFRFVDFETGEEFLGREYQAIYDTLISKSTQFPFPYGFRPYYASHGHYTEVLDIRRNVYYMVLPMINTLNSRRGSLLLNLKNISDIQSLMNSLSLSQLRLAKIKKNNY
jgi:predicted hydrocarbon binding protein